VNNYRNVRVTNINNTTIINNYRAAPVVNNTVVNNYGTNKQRYNYTNKPVNQKPHNSVIKRIQQNETIIHKDMGKRENAAVLQQQVKRAPKGKINRESRVALPKITNRIVPAKEVNRPKSEIQFQQKEIKRRGEGATGTRPGQIGRPQRQPLRPEQAAPERVKPARPALQEKPGRTGEPERVAPQITDKPEKPGQIGRPKIQPVRPEQVGPERAKPARPGLREKPARTGEPERVAPEISGQPGKPGQIGRPQRQPVRPEQVRPERVKPAKPAPAVAPEKEKPAKPGKREKSKEELEKQENPR
jgi:hypothetical protein